MLVRVFIPIYDHKGERIGVRIATVYHQPIIPERTGTYMIVRGGVMHQARRPQRVAA